MKILSIDVGIKNLAFCLFSFEKTVTNEATTLKIISWDIINLSQPKVSAVCTFIEKDKDKGKGKANANANANACGKPAKFEKDTSCYCLKHAKKQTSFLTPTASMKPAFIKKQKMAALHEMANQYHLVYDTVSTKKADLVNLILSFLSQHCLQEVEKVNASKVDLIDIGTNIKNKFNEWFHKEGKIDYVLIENQISPIANRMKTIQGMISQYFIMSENQVDFIEFVSSANKLKETGTSSQSLPTATSHTTSHTTYKERKNNGISKCLEILQQSFPDVVPFFQSHKKKDDLADCLLQGMWYINTKLK